MKVLHVTNSLATGGAEKLILDSFPIFKKKYVNVDLFLLNSYPYPFLKKLKEKKINKIYSSKIKSIYNPLHVFKLIQIINNYDIVHVHLFPSQYWVVIAKTISFSKVKLIFTEHCTTNRRMDNCFFRIINKFVYTFYDVTVCISEEIQDCYAKYTGLNLKRLPIIENGIDLNVISNAKPIPRDNIHPTISNEDILTIQVSAFREQKNQPTLIKAIKVLPENYKLILVGSGETMHKSIKLVRELKLEERVVFLGDRSDVPRLLKSSDIIALSTHYEGLSLASIEGMASSRPFIASNVPGLSKLIINAGVLFEVDDFDSISSIILQLATDKKYYKQIVDACLNKSKKYDINVMVESYIDVYKQTVGICAESTV